ncbi:MAG: hypothetical protein HDR30_05015 [Lachnospiraceae bacterium]|nr:hypothetical protein [Lachnospiraceae bacterium]
MKKLWEKQEKKDMESVIFLLLLLVMAVYYGWRLFALTPWYDELYTYYFFISRGPVYAAIHWPLPNNHVGFSVLSAILDLFGNAAVGLRGISWISSLISLCLLFAIGKKCFPKGFALAAPLLYSSMELVNQLAVQGRGYALASCLYLTAFYELIRIVKCKETKKRHYIVLAGAFIWAIYTLPSSVYFVMPLCIIGGGWLLLERRIKEFWQLFVTALISAVCVTGLYAIIWLAIGSNLLSKMPERDFYGQSHVSIILHAPFSALSTGIKYMLDTPYIQSVPREGYLSRFGIWIKTLFEYYYSGLSIILLIVAGIALLGVVIALFRNPAGFLEWYLLLSFILTPLMLIIQAALPYYRVFSFFGIPLALLLIWLAVKIFAAIKKPVLAYGVTACAALLCIIRLCSPSYLAQYSDREAAIEDAYEHMDLQSDKTVFVSDCDQEYLVKYLYDREDTADTMQDADYILLDKLLLLTAEEFEKANSADKWKFYVFHNEIAWDYIEKETDLCYENERFVLYERKSAY